MPSDSEVREQLSRILASAGFTSSSRMNRFLRFVVEAEMQGRGAELKEYLLGLEIFDRPASFDPRMDPIVRVEARRLRAKLKAYYEGEGRNDPVRIELPTGGYVPRFSDQAAQPGRERREAVAVLPFANLGTEAGDYFSDGLTEELIHALTKIQALRVVAWTSAARFKDRQDDFRAIGRELGVGAVLTGSVRRAGGRVRITARLVDTAAGEYIWSEAYDRQLEDLFDIQRQISEAIAASLKMKLLGARPAPPSVEAYDLYLRGRFHWNKRTREELERGVDYFERAIAADPQYAPAWSGLADAYTLQADHSLRSPAEVMPKARQAAMRALELDPDLADPYASLALIESVYEWQWAQAEAHYRRAIELNPGYVTAHHWYGCDLLALHGRFDEACAEMDQAARLDPLSHILWESYAHVLMLARRYDDSLAMHRKAQELEPHYYKHYTSQGRIAMHQGRHKEAVELLLKGHEIAGDNPALLGALGQAYGTAGRVAEARAVLARLTEIAERDYVPSTAFALLHCGLGETGRALEWLERGCERHDLPLAAIKVHPGYDSLRGEPRFAAILTRIGLSD